MEKRELFGTVGGRRVWRLLQKLQTKLSCDPVIPLLGIYPKEMKTLTQKDICIPMFTAVLFTIAKIWKQPKCLLTDAFKKKVSEFSSWLHD